MENKKQNSVEWLMQKIALKYGEFQAIAFYQDNFEAIQQAEAMHNQEIVETARYYFHERGKLTPQQLYNKTFGGKTMSKLYTEEQVRKAYSAGAIDCEYKCTKVELKGFEPVVNMDHLKMLMNSFIETLTPIQLPSDEEIEERAERNISPFSFTDGAKWMIDKIKGGNNE